LLLELVFPFDIHMWLNRDPSWPPKCPQLSNQGLPYLYHPFTHQLPTIHPPSSQQLLQSPRPFGKIKLPIPRIWTSIGTIQCVRLANQNSIKLDTNGGTKRFCGLHISQHTATIVRLFPICSMVLVYLPTWLGDFVRANVGKYSIHGAYGL
jgi:hypothetical protein